MWCAFAVTIVPGGPAQMQSDSRLFPETGKHLGGTFNIKEFHNAVLGSGSLPLPVLQKAVDQYIASK